MLCCACVERVSITVMDNQLTNLLWSVGARGLHLSKRLGVSEFFEHTLLKVALGLMPPPSTETSVTLPFGATMVIPPGFPRARTYLAGVYEQEVTALFGEVLQEGMNVIDVGAFCGYYALVSAHLVGSSGRVYAFEPEPTNYAYLCRNVEANGFHNVIVKNSAVSNVNGSGALTLQKEKDHHSLSVASSGASSVTVPVVSLDSFLAQEEWPRIDLVKMDIEGGEKRALEGMQEMSRRNPNLCLIMEFEIRNILDGGSTTDALKNVLTGLGFERYCIVEQGMNWVPLSKGLPSTNMNCNLLVAKR